MNRRARSSFGLHRKVRSDGLDECARVACIEDTADIDVGRGGIYLNPFAGVTVYTFSRGGQRLVIEEHLAILPSGHPRKIYLIEAGRLAVLADVQRLSGGELDDGAGRIVAPPTRLPAPRGRRIGVKARHGNMAFDHRHQDVASDELDVELRPECNDGLVVRFDDEWPARVLGDIETRLALLQSD